MDDCTYKGQRVRHLERRSAFFMDMAVLKESAGHLFAVACLDEKAAKLSAE